MAENPREQQEYQFINETIVPNRKLKWKKRLGSLFFTMILAVVFGIIAQAVFLLAEEPLRELLGLKDSGRQEIDLPSPTKEAEPTGAVSTPVPTITGMPEPTGAADITEIPSIEVTPGPCTPVPTESVEITPSPVEKNPETGDEDLYGGWYSFAMFQEQIAELTEQASRSVVAMNAVENGVDWFQEPYETRTAMTGLIFANDGIDLLILTGSEPLLTADFIEVQLAGKVVEGRLFAADSGYGLAVVAVPLESISEEMQAQIEVGKIASVRDIKKGSPVIALGAPNGYQNSVEYGMITGLGGSRIIIDGEVPYFTTNLNDYEQGHGFIINLQGEVLGMITHTHKGGANDGVSSAISLDAVRGMIVKLSNHSEISYFGIYGENLPPALVQAGGVTKGVYVREVKMSSPALAAGIKSGDVLVMAGGSTLEGIQDFTRVLLAAKPKDTLEVKLLRVTGDGVKEVTLNVELTKRAEN